jgi:hypothetical protein
VTRTQGDTKSANTTRAIEAMRKAQRLGILDGAILAIGTRSRPRRGGRLVE